LRHGDGAGQRKSSMIPTEIQSLIERGALFVVNHSGGKDSQAMDIVLSKVVPPAQLVRVHADLGAVEWAGAVEHIRATIGSGRLEVCRNENRDLLQMIEQRGMFPSPSIRQCTSDLKRGPIERTIRRLVNERKERGDAGWNLVVNCMGMRAEESPNRAKLTTFKLSKGNSVAGREWYDWLPIHDMLIGEVFATIAAAGQQPHVVYSYGMSRFSCCFCVMAAESDLTTAAQLSQTNPELFNDPTVYRQYVMLERTTGQVMLMPSKSRGRRTLEEVTGVYIDGDAPARKVMDADQKAPIALTDEELQAEADQLATRISHSTLPLRDVRLVQELAARAARKPFPLPARS
jgi:3'-phosphoadenosine 5'-phosphosulfate sulfotransferase (PAPS reductase)/FAD synthetase